MPYDDGYTDPYEMPKEFEFPKNLKSLTDAQREQLHLDYIQHYAKPGSCEAQPSKTMTPESTEFKAKVYLKKMHKGSDLYFTTGSGINVGGFAFDPMKGYIVPGEAEGVVDHVPGMTPEDKERIMKKPPREITEQELDMAKMAMLSPVERDIEERFGDI